MAIAKSNVNVKINADVKELASQLLARMGIDQTTAIDIFFRQIIAERRLPFQPTVTLSLDEQIVVAALRRNPKRVSLPTDENGNLIIDSEEHPDIYDSTIRLYDASKLVTQGIFKKLQQDNAFVETCTVLNHTPAWTPDKSYSEETCLDLDPCNLYRQCPVVGEPDEIFALEKEK